MDGIEIAAELEKEIENTEVKLNTFILKLESCDANKENHTITINFKIHDLLLPIFSEKYEEFQNFKSQFMSIIGNWNLH